MILYFTESSQWSHSPGVLPLPCVWQPRRRCCCYHHHRHQQHPCHYCPHYLYYSHHYRRHQKSLPSLSPQSHGAKDVVGEGLNQIWSVFPRANQRRRLGARTLMSFPGGGRNKAKRRKLHTNMFSEFLGLTMLRIHDATTAVEAARRVFFAFFCLSLS